jgi:hypothetical protein
LIIGVIEDDTLLDDGTGWIHEVTCELIMKWLESGLTPCRVLCSK